HLQILRRSRRPLLCGMEQARRSALAHHVHRTAPMGPRVLINGIWYNKTRLLSQIASHALIEPLKQVICAWLKSAAQSPRSANIGSLGGGRCGAALCSEGMLVM